MQVIGKRWLTPLRLSTRGSFRAAKATASTISATNGGMTDGISPLRLSHASCRVMAIPSPGVNG